MKYVLVVDVERHDMGFAADVRAEVTDSVVEILDGRVLGNVRVQLPPRVVPDLAEVAREWEPGQENPGEQIARALSKLPMFGHQQDAPPHLDFAVRLALGLLRTAMLEEGITGLVTRSNTVEML